jgi:hypothetical protein
MHLVRDGLNGLVLAAVRVASGRVKEALLEEVRQVDESQRLNI